MNPKSLDQYTPEERTPLTIMMDIETPEPVSNEYREASLAFLRVIRLAIDFILRAENPKMAAYGVAYCLRVPTIIEISMRQRSRELGVSHNTISFYVQQFKRLLEL